MYAYLFFKYKAKFFVRGKLMKKIVGILIVTVLVLCGCGPAKTSEREQQPQQPPSGSSGGIAYFGIESNLELVENEQGKVFRFTLKNQSDRPEKLEFSSSLEYDYKVIDGSGEIVKQRSKEIVAAQRLKTVTLKQAQELVYEEDYDEVTKGLPQGSYTVEFSSTAKGKQIQSSLAIEIK